MWAFQATGAAPLVLGQPVPNPETVATAIRIGNPASTDPGGRRPGGVRRSLRVRSPTRRSSLHKAFLAAREGVFVEPASAAGVAGLRRPAERGEVDRGQQIVVTVTGHGLKDIDTALSARDRAGRGGAGRR